MIVGVVVIVSLTAFFVASRFRKRNYVSEANSALFRIDNRQSIFSYDEIIAANRLVLELLDKANAKISSLGITEELFSETILGAHERARDHLLNKLQNDTSHKPELLSLELRKHLEIAPLPDKYGTSTHIAELVAQNHARAAWQLLATMRTARGLAQKTDLLKQILEHTRLAGKLDETFGRELQDMHSAVVQETIERNGWTNLIPITGNAFIEQ